MAVEVPFPDFKTRERIMNNFILSPGWKESESFTWHLPKSGDISEWGKTFT